MATATKTSDPFSTKAPEGVSKSGPKISQDAYNPFSDRLFELDSTEITPPSLDQVRRESFTDNVLVIGGKAELRINNTPAAVETTTPIASQEITTEGIEPKPAPNYLGFILNGPVNLESAEQIIQKSVNVAGSLAGNTLDAGGDILAQIRGAGEYATETPKQKKEASVQEPPKLEVRPQQNQQAYEIAQEIARLAQDRKNNPGLAEALENFNRVVGLAGNFEGSMDKMGNKRIDLVAVEERANSEALRVQRSTQTDMALGAKGPSKKGAKGPGVQMSMDKQNENPNGATKLAG